MKAIRALLTFAALTLTGALATANCGNCEAPDQAAKDKPKCEAKCDKPCEKAKECAPADKAKCDKEKMSCCEEAAKEGKPCEKCNPPEPADKK